ncbi:F-box only protein 28 [Ditylenchus destructor]|uniref:F-box only protein 28 n=1 Tax=Ditylenchus destructor TaxID=166010 RepID=A0AAD4MWN2_9BILA|nr:F-box only protein 28 [Ditylenchus destructor]
MFARKQSAGSTDAYKLKAQSLVQDTVNSNSSNAFVQLPAVVLQKLVRYLSYEEMSRTRQVCQKLKYHCELQLNEGFTSLGRQVSGSTARLKKQLPKKESERRAHPLNRYSEVFSALETRYTLLSMTYKKYIDMNMCCFIPGRVLDIAFGIVRRINGYLANEGNVIQLDVIQILRDIRDYSSMAMEHFDEHIAPQYPNKSMLSFSSMSGKPPSSMVAHCCAAIYANAHNASGSENDETDEQMETLRQEIRNGLEEKDRVIDELRKEIAQQRTVIGQVVGLLAQVGKRDEWNHTMLAALNKITSGCGIPQCVSKAQKASTSGTEKTQACEANAKDDGPEYVSTKLSVDRKRKHEEENGSKEETHISKTERMDDPQSVVSTITVSSERVSKAAYDKSAQIPAPRRYTLRERKPGGYTSFAFPAQASVAPNLLPSNPPTTQKNHKRKISPEVYDFSLEMVKDAKQSRT